MSAFSSPIIGGGGGSGDVTAPVSSTDNAIVRFDGVTGEVIQDSSVLIDDAGTVNGAKIHAGLNIYSQAVFGGL